MLKKYRERLRHCHTIEQDVRKASPEALQQIQDKLNSAIPESTSMFNFVLPLLLSTFLMMLSFALAQFSLWQLIVQFMALPAVMTLVLMVIGSLIMAAVYVITLIVMSKGYMAAARAHLWLVGFTLLLAGLYFISAFFRTVPEEAGFITPLLSVAFIVASLVVTGSQRFYASLQYSLLLRASRKRIVGQRHTPSAR